MTAYWLTLAIDEEELAEEMNCPIDEIEDGDYLGAIRDFGQIVKFEKLD